MNNFDKVRAYAKAKKMGKGRKPTLFEKIIEIYNETKKERCF